MTQLDRASGYVSGRLPGAGASTFPGGARSGLRRWASYRGYAWGVLATSVSFLTSWLAAPYAVQADLVMIHLLGVVLIAIEFSVLVSIFTGIISILAFDYFFIPPVGQMSLPDGKSILTFAVMMIVAGVISTLQQRVRRQEMRSRRNEAKTATLYALTGDLVEVHEVPPLLAIASRHLERSFGAKVRALRGDSDGSLRNDDEQHLRPDERILAKRAWETRELVVDVNQPGMNAWQPLVGTHRMVGVLGLNCGASLVEDADQRQLLAACATQVAIAVERELLATAVQRIQVEAESERLRSSLLAAVSHDLRTPLAAILAAGTTLSEQYERLETTQGRELLSTIVSEAERLNGLLHNLLSITRLESGVIELKRTSEALDEVLGGVLSRLEARLEGRDLVIDLPADLPEVAIDPGLVDQLLVNLIENALRYTPKEAKLYVRARAVAAGVAVQVADAGPGIAEDERARVFEKFYRGRHASKADGGVGLGLTICRAIVRAHDGHISIRERPGGGTLVEFTLPRAAESSFRPEMRA